MEFYCKIKHLLLAILVTSPVAIATQMEGFGSHYYLEDSSVTDIETRKGLVPDVIVGGNSLIMEFSRLEDIAKIANTMVNQDDLASWLCLSARGQDYWFISDNEMGKGDLTSIAISKAEQQKTCVNYSGDLSVSIQGIPLLNASLENISSTFSDKTDRGVIQYCTDKKTDSDYTQMNCLKYYLKDKTVSGVIISQITSN